MMKQYITIALCTLAGFGVMVCATPGAVYAYDPLDEACSQSKDSPTCKEQVAQNANPLTGDKGLLVRIAQLIAVITGVAAVIVGITAGISYITSSGDPQQAQRAKARLKGALIGVVLAALAGTFVTLVVTRL